MSDLGKLERADLAKTLHPTIAEDLGMDWDDGDPYASGMEGLFAVAGILDLDSQPIPETWRWHPAPGFGERHVRESDVGGLLLDDLRDHRLTYDDLRTAGEALLWHLAWCDANGRSY